MRKTLLLASIRRALRTLAFASATVFVGSAAADTAYVTNGDDDGPGSFRWAVANANASGAIDAIDFDDSLEVILESPVIYTGTQDLQIQGEGSTIRGSKDAPPAETWDAGLFVSAGGANLKIGEIHFVDSFNNGIGIFVPPLKVGTVEIELKDISIETSRFHGLYVDDQITPRGSYNTDDVIHPDCVDPYEVESNASIWLKIEDAEILGNGTLAGGYDTGTEFEDPISGDIVLTGCPADFDGVRVDEGGLGGVQAFLKDSRVKGNLADGVEYDERGDGDVVAEVESTLIKANGETGTDDLDDGFDIDEADNGDLIAFIKDVRVVANRDEGLDFDEEGEGSAYVEVIDTIASRNEDQGVKVDEEGDGDLIAKIEDSKVNNSLSQDGIEFTEEDDGNLDALVEDSKVRKNDDAGIKAEQVGSGSGVLEVKDSKVKKNNEISPGVFGDQFDLTGVVLQIGD